MAEKTRNLCAQIPVELHDKVRQRQAESGETLSRYMTALITKFYEMEENAKMDKDNVRTVAFQVPTELFEQLKAYLKRNGIKQNAFFLDCIRQALAAAVAKAAVESGVAKQPIADWDAYAESLRKRYQE